MWVASSGISICRLLVSGGGLKLDIGSGVGLGLGAAAETSKVRQTVAELVEAAVDVVVLNIDATEGCLRLSDQIVRNDRLKSFLEGGEWQCFELLDNGVEIASRRGLTDTFKSFGCENEVASGDNLAKRLRDNLCDKIVA